MNGPRVQHCAAAERSTVKRKGEPAYGPQRAGNGRSVVDWTVMSSQDEPIVTAENNASVVRLAQPGRALHQRVKHGLDIRRGSRDHAKDLAGGRLLLERLTQSVLDFRIGRSRRTTRAETLERRATLETEICFGEILLLAPGTLHDEDLQLGQPNPVRWVSRD